MKFKLKMLGVLAVLGMLAVYPVMTLAQVIDPSPFEVAPAGDVIAVPTAGDEAPEVEKAAETEAATAAVAESETSGVAATAKALASDTAPGVGWIPSVLFGLNLLLMLLTKMDWLIPSGYRTKTTVIVAGLTLVIDFFTEMSAPGHATMKATILAALGNVWQSYNKPKTKPVTA